MMLFFAFIVVATGSSNTAIAAARHYSLKTADIEIPKCVGSTLDRIANAFHRKTGRDLVVTDGTRTIAAQAKLVALNLSEGKNIVALYAEKELAREVTRAYRSVPREQRAERGVAVVESTLRAQVERGEYLSKHMRKGAIDLRVSDLSAEQRKVLAKIIRQADVVLVDESRGKRPHYHLNFLACLDKASTSS